MKKLKLISLNLVGLFVIILLFNFPTFNKMKPQATEPIIMHRDVVNKVRARIEIKPMKTLEETEEVLTPAGGYRIRPLTPLPIYEYPAAVGEELEEVSLNGEPKNGDHAEYSEPAIVQIINALGDNITKIMAGLLTLSQILLNFRTFRNRKKPLTEEQIFQSHDKLKRIIL